MREASATLTTPDLVILSLLAERPMHGYEVNVELERRQARDWVAISRPQIYYSLAKLAREDLPLVRLRRRCVRSRGVLATAQPHPRDREG